MIKFEKTFTMNFENAIRGARNPLNSWGRMDSSIVDGKFVFGPNGARVLKGTDGSVLVCEGSCKRELRPFMCRIFPFYAKFTKDTNCARTKISLVPDPRSFRICPVGAKRKGTRKSVYFLRYTKRAVRILCNDRDFAAEFSKHAEYADSLYELYRKMFISK